MEIDRSSLFFSEVQDRAGSNQCMFIYTLQSDHDMIRRVSSLSILAKHVLHLVIVSVFVWFSQLYDCCTISPFHKTNHANTSKHYTVAKK